jgi:hypothetical protein
MASGLAQGKAAGAGFRPQHLSEIFLFYSQQLPAAPICAQQLRFGSQTLRFWALGKALNFVLLRRLPRGFPISSL